MPYDSLDDVPHSIRAALMPSNQTLSPCPSHYSRVSATPSPQPHEPAYDQQVMSSQAVTASSSGLITASLQQQRMHLEIPSDVLLEFQQNAAFDTAILSDLRAAFQELHDRVQHRTSVLGAAATALHDGYTTVMREFMALQGVVQRQAESIEQLATANGSLRTELEQVRVKLSDSQQELSDVKMGFLQWHAQVEAHIANIEGQLSLTGQAQDVQAQRIDDLFRACTEAVGSHDPAARTAIESLAGRMETVEELVKAAAGATESVQKGLCGVNADLEVIQNKQEQMLDRLESIAVQENTPTGAVPQGSGFGVDTNQNMGGAPVLSMTPGAPTNLNHGAVQGTPAPEWDADWTAPGQSSGWDAFDGQWPNVSEPPGLPPILKKPPENTASTSSGIQAPTTSIKEIPNARWKSLNEVPMTLAGTVSADFAEYVARCFKLAQDRHDLQARGDSLPALEPVKGYPSEFESRLVIVLLNVLPDIIKTPALETDENQQGIGSLRLLEELYLRVRPGGLEEQQTLVRFLRNLSPASSAREAIEVLRRWRLAKSRVSALSLPEIPAYEQVKGIMTLLKTLEKRYDALKTRLALVRIHPDIQLGKPNGVTHLLDSVEQELRRLSADETTKDNLNQLHEPTVSKGKGDKGTGKGLTAPKNVEAQRHVPCPYLEPGGCSFGDRCHYKHDLSDKPDKPHPKPRPKPKPAPKKKCIFHKLGFKCKFLHEGPSGASGAAKADGEDTENALVGGDAQQAKGKAKSKPKAKAPAASSFACMIRASISGDARNPWPFLYLPNWNVFVCDLTYE